MTKVFGVGWAKTGTKTLGRCLQLLGYRHQSRRLDLVEDLSRGDLSRIMAIARAKQSFEDWPWLLLYREFDDAFPGSKFVLTLRDSSKWLTSYRNLLRTEGSSSGDLQRIRSVLYGMPVPAASDEQLLHRYQSHNEAVREYFSHRPGSLLVVNWEEGDGWNELCSFLEVAVPSAPFPHANRGRYGVEGKVRSALDRLRSIVRGLGR